MRSLMQPFTKALMMLHALCAPRWERGEGGRAQTWVHVHMHACMHAQYNKHAHTHREVNSRSSALVAVYIALV